MIEQENELMVLHENAFGELEWSKVKQINLGSYKVPNLKIRQIKIQPKLIFKPF